jgi:DNA-binding XRE family transcriptional regulator
MLRLFVCGEPLDGTRASTAVARDDARWEWEKGLSEKVAKRVGPKVGRLREERGLSQEELANRAGLHRTGIGLLETGKRAPRLVTFLVIAGVLEVEPSYLLEGIYRSPGIGGGEGRLTDEPPSEIGLT